MFLYSYDSMFLLKHLAPPLTSLLRTLFPTSLKIRSNEKITTLFCHIGLHHPRVHLFLSPHMNLFSFFLNHCIRMNILPACLYMHYVHA